MVALFTLSRGRGGRRKKSNVRRSAMSSLRRWLEQREPDEIGPGLGLELESERA